MSTAVSMPYEVPELRRSHTQTLLNRTAAFQMAARAHHVGSSVPHYAVYMGTWYGYLICVVYPYHEDRYNSYR